ncbi:MAG TPA: hypothetical protein VMG10_32490, partial [Gemmataceae bacterium]|nr:hypothetical protein [Gemmataceae bacterium]
KAAEKRRTPNKAAEKRRIPNKAAEKRRIPNKAAEKRRTPKKGKALPLPSGRGAFRQTRQTPIRSANLAAPPRCSVQ